MHGSPRRGFFLTIALPHRILLLIVLHDDVIIKPCALLLALTSHTRILILVRILVLLCFRGRLALAFFFGWRLAVDLYLDLEVHRLSFRSIR